MTGLDIGPDSAAAFAEVVCGAGTVLWNGPLGAFEDPRFAEGTRIVAEAVAQGDAQYGLPRISEMLPNKDVTVWPLPDDIKMTTIYAAALSTNAENAMDAHAMLDDLRGPKGRDASLNAGLKPVGN